MFVIELEKEEDYCDYTVAMKLIEKDYLSTQITVYGIKMKHLSWWNRLS